MNPHVSLTHSTSGIISSQVIVSWRVQSVSWHTEDGWANAARAGVVDGFFDEALARAPELAVRVVNLRR